ncbi:MAG: hypothetical protein ACJ8H8_19705, partial [Geminicoccaceae bacterium]
TKQAVTLGDLVGRLDRLEIRCKRCDRQGRVRLTKLIAEHGAELGLPELAVLLAADCTKVAATNQADRCFVHFP